MEMTIDESIKRLQAFLKCVQLSDEQKKAISNGIKALEKQTPKKLVRGFDEEMLCAGCSAFICWEHNLNSELHQQTKYCEFCGQAIDWGE